MYSWSVLEGAKNDKREVIKENDVYY